MNHPGDHTQFMKKKIIIFLKIISVHKSDCRHCMEFQSLHSTDVIKCCSVPLPTPTLPPSKYLYSGNKS